jgi:hypothetical protein
VVRYGLQDGNLVLLGQKDLEGVAGEDDKVEAFLQSNRAGIAFNPPHLVSTRPFARDVQHRLGGVDACNAPAPVAGEVRSEHSRAATQVENRQAIPGTVLARQRPRGPAIVEIVELGEIHIFVKLVHTIANTFYAPCGHVPCSLIDEAP